MSEQIPISKTTTKRYACERCGYETTQQTNHYGNTWSHDRFNVCPECPPFAKYAEFGGQTIWRCLEIESVNLKSNIDEQQK